MMTITLEQIFNLSEEESLLKEEARRFAEEVLEPIAAETLEMNTFSKEHFWRVFEKLAEHGFTAMGIPAEYGGVDVSSRTSTVFTEELCRVDGANGLSAGATSSLVANPINVFGTDKQKSKWLPAIATGDVIGAYCQTEPDAGSDVAGIKTKATEKDGKWFITGTKRFITNGSEANLALVIARTGIEHHKGLTAFLVDCDKAREAGTLDTSKNEHKAGLHQSPTTEMVFDDCEAESILGVVGGGWVVAMTTLSGSRATVIPAQGVGIARGAYELAETYVKERKQFGEPIGNFPVIRQELIEMQAKIEMARLLAWQAALLKDEAPKNDSRPYMLEASCAKLVASEFAEDVASNAMQLFGGNGYIMESKVAKFWHDARIVKIYEGTSHIQKKVIVGTLFQRLAFSLLPLMQMSTDELENQIYSIATEWPASQISDVPEILKANLENSSELQVVLDIRVRFLKTLLKNIPKFESPDEYSQFFKSNDLPAFWFRAAWSLSLIDAVSLVVLRSISDKNLPENYNDIVQASIKIAMLSGLELQI